MIHYTKKIAIFFVATFFVTTSAYSGDVEHEISAIISKYAISEPNTELLKNFSNKVLSLEEQKSFLNSFDKYSELIPAKDLKKIIKISQEKKAGVGMDIVWDKYGHIVCIPSPRSPAVKANINYGDILVSIDNRKVSDLASEAYGKPDLAEVASLLRGSTGESVELGLIRQHDEYIGSNSIENGIPLTATVRRAEGSYPSVRQLYSVAGIPRIRIYRFATSTPIELDAILRKLSRHAPLILDLRGNTGGDLDAALACIARFLPKDVVIFERESRGSYKTPVTHESGTHSKIDLYIWQDALTASSAEVCIAALKQNERVVSVGLPSAGKACAQEWFRLRNGSQLKLTTELFFTPQEGKSWQDIGLLPDVPLRKGETFKQAMKELVGQE